MMKQHLAILCDNKPGVLTHVAGLISRRAINIEYLNAGYTDEPDVTRINNEVQKLLSKAKFETEIISFVAGLAAKSHGVKNGKMAIYRGIISKYGREKGLEIYDKLKTLLSDPDLWK